MNVVKVSLIAMAVLTIAACNVFKKHTATAPPATAAADTKPSVTDKAPVPKSRDGVFAPGNEELVAIQAKYKDVTMKTLNDGYAIYTGACTNCHGTKSIYSRPAEAWPLIIDDMAQGAKITDAQKEAVVRYVLAIKATQPH